MGNPETKPLPWRVKLAYGAPNFGLALMGAPILVYLPRFYSDGLGVALSTIGAVILLGRVLDAVTDPLMGYLSDRSAHRMGRRRPFIAWGAVPLALCGVALYVPPDLGPRGAGIWMAAAAIAWFVWFTIVSVPYRALGPELSPDYDARTSVFAVREALFVVGTLLAVAGPAVAGLALGLPPDGPERERYALYAAFAAPLLVGLCFICVRGVAEAPARATPPTAPTQRPRLSELWRAALGTLDNRPFAILLSAWVMAAFGSSMPIVLINYFVEYVLRSDLLPVFICVYFVAGLLALPLWVRLAGRIGKRDAWRAAMAVNFGFFAPIAALGPGDELAYGLLVACSGLGGVAVLTLPTAMQADVIDQDELLTGARREGLYTGLWSIAEKAAAALGIGVAMWVLDLVGYVANEVQDELVLDTLRALYVGVPTICALACFVFARRYPLDRAAHERIRAQLDARQRT